MTYWLWYYTPHNNGAWHMTSANSEQEARLNAIAEIDGHVQGITHVTTDDPNLHTGCIE